MRLLHVCGFLDRLFFAVDSDGFGLSPPLWHDFHAAEGLAWVIKIDTQVEYVSFHLIMQRLREQMYNRRMLMKIHFCANLP